MRTHRLFGFTVASDFPFRSRLAAGEPPAELTVKLVSEPPVAVDGLEPDYASPQRTPEGETLSRVFRLPALDVLVFAGLADFYVADDRIDCHLRGPSREDLVEIQLLGSVLSYWLERRGLPTLHASAVEVAGRAVVFLSSHHGGKTSLAAAMMGRERPLLTDDILPLEEADGAVLGRPGYPQMRMWPDAAAHFRTRWKELDVVHPGYSKRRVPVSADGFCGSPRPLACLYLPQRRRSAETGRGIEIAPLRPRDAVMELVRHSFSPYVVEAVGWQARRLGFFARLAGRVPVRRLSFPSGFEHLPAVRREVLRDFDRLRRAGELA